MFSALGSIVLLPIAHVLIKQRGQGLEGFALTHIAVMTLSYLLALFFYLTHIPEKWWPNKFDIWVSGPHFSTLFCGLRTANLLEYFGIYRGQAIRYSTFSSLSARLYFCWDCER